MSSDEFMDKWESGELDDRDDYFDWFAAKKGFDVWDRRLRILAGVNISQTRQKRRSSIRTC